MSMVKLVIRGLSVAMIAGGGAIVAVQNGVLAGPANAPQADLRAAPASTLFSASTADRPADGAATRDTGIQTTAPVAPALPVPSSASFVSLPDETPVTVTQAAMQVPDLPGALAGAIVGAMAGQDADPGVSAFGLPCDLNVTTSAMPGALIALDVMAPCQPEARVVVEHSGLTLTGRTDAMGLMVMDLPAFQSPAYLTVHMPGGESRNALVHVPDLNDYDRVAVQWEEDRQLMLHAMPAGIDFGAPGHLWADAPGRVEDAVVGQSGVWMALGSAEVDTPMLAQVVTYPRAALSEDRPVALSIDAPITEATCGKPVEARAIERARSGDVDVVPMSLTLPGCDAVGDYLVLQNLFQDLTVAAN